MFFMFLMFVQHLFCQQELIYYWKVDSIAGVLVPNEPLTTPTYVSTFHNIMIHQVKSLKVILSSRLNHHHIHSSNVQIFMSMCLDNNFSFKRLTNHIQPVFRIQLRIQLDGPTVLQDVLHQN